MKKIIFLIVLSVSFILHTNAQKLYIKNTTNTYNVTVTAGNGPFKYQTSCNSVAFLPMTLDPTIPNNVIPIIPNHSATYLYPLNYSITANFKVGVRYMQPGSVGMTVSFCGVAQYNIVVPGTAPQVFIDIYPAGGTSILVYYHY